MFGFTNADKQKTAEQIRTSFGGFDSKKNAYKDKVRKESLPQLQRNVVLRRSDPSPVRHHVKDGRIILQRMYRRSHTCPPPSSDPISLPATNPSQPAGSRLSDAEQDSVPIRVTGTPSPSPSEHCESRKVSNFSTHRRSKLWKKVTKLLSSSFGLFFLLMAYMVMGSFLFTFIEHSTDVTLRARLEESRWQMAQEFLSACPPEQSNKTVCAYWYLRKYENVIFQFPIGVLASSHDLWTFQNSFYFCFTTITTIGYGNLTPTTEVGRIVLVIYAIFGIPLMLLLVADIGTVTARWLKRCAIRVRDYRRRSIAAAKRSIKRRRHPKDTISSLPVSTTAEASVWHVNGALTTSITSDGGVTAVDDSGQKRTETNGTFGIGDKSHADKKDGHTMGYNVSDAAKKNATKGESYLTDKKTVKGKERLHNSSNGEVVKRNGRRHDHGNPRYYSDESDTDDDIEEVIGEVLEDDVDLRDMIEDAMHAAAQEDSESDEDDGAFYDNDCQPLEADETGTYANRADERQRRPGLAGHIPDRPASISMPITNQKNTEAEVYAKGDTDSTRVNLDNGPVKDSEKPKRLRRCVSESHSGRVLSVLYENTADKLDGQCVVVNAGSLLHDNVHDDRNAMRHSIATDLKHPDRGRERAGAGGGDESVSGIASDQSTAKDNESQQRPTTGTEQSGEATPDHATTERTSSPGLPKQVSRVSFLDESVDDNVDKEVDHFSFPWWLAFLLLFAYLIGGMLMFSYTMGWGKIDSFYYAFVSLSTIGFGDMYYQPSFYPGSVYYNFAYSFIGFCYTSMCMNLSSRELVRISRRIAWRIGYYKSRRWKRDFRAFWSARKLKAPRKAGRWTRRRRNEVRPRRQISDASSSFRA